jgi:uridylate kinase
MPKRVILKVSGELFGSNDYPVDSSMYADMAARILAFKQKNDVNLVVVPGGGNIFRGRQVEGFKMDRAMADYAGMLATVINGIMLSEAIIAQGHTARNMTSFQMPAISEAYIHKKAQSHLRRDFIVVISGGLGRPFVSTDTTVAHMACELDCDVVLKATNVDGIYDKDPRKHSDAILIPRLTYQQALERRLNVMDSTAFAMCQDHHKPILVFDVDHLEKLDVNNLENFGTLVTD